MRGWTKAALVATVAGAVIAGCGRFGFVQRDEWRGQAEAQCLRAGAVKASAHIRPAGPINDQHSCGMDQALKVSALADGRVDFDRDATLGCPMVAATQAWLEEVVQPAAERHFGARVARMRTGSYACRGRNGASGGPLSEHAFGNALDVFSFTFADGRDTNVARGWKGMAEEQNFLREIFVGACGRYSTVLGPGSDAFHYDHFHLDLARRLSRNGEAHCRPVIKYEVPVASAPPLAESPPPEPAAELPPAPISAQARPKSFLERLLPF